MLKALQNLRQHLLTGVSFAIPFIACGGILIAIAIAFAAITATGPDFSQAPRLKLILNIGSAALTLMLPVLAGYISYSVSGKPGLLPGFLGGYFSGEIRAGFLGAMLAGLLDGYFGEDFKRGPLPKSLRGGRPRVFRPDLSRASMGIR